MYTIRDYLNYYKNASVKEVHWNSVDNMLCATLVYLPVESYTGVKTIQELYDYAHRYVDYPKESRMTPQAYEMLELMHECPRYKDMKIYNWVNEKNEETQFGAAVFRIGSDTTISYKGTDSSFIGWIENFRLAYEYPTRTHMLAINYLKDNVKFWGDKNLYITGHSKGGNLAMISAMEAGDRIWNKIRKIYNFDGPGFRKDEFEGERYKKLSGKLYNILPTGSIVGVLLYNENYTVVKSGKVAIEEHDLTSWSLFGECFVEGKLSGISSRLQETSTKGIEHLDYDKTRAALESVFESFEKDVTMDFSMKLEDVITFVKNMKDIDPEVREGIEEIMEALLSSRSSVRRASETLKNIYPKNVDAEEIKKKLSSKLRQINLRKNEEADKDDE